MEVKSTQIWAARASTNSGQSESAGSPMPATPSTTAGPTELQESPREKTSRCGWRPANSTSGSIASRFPAATKSGTTAAGRKKSIGTNASWEMSALPAPRSKRMRVVMA